MRTAPALAALVLLVGACGDPSTTTGDTADAVEQDTMSTADTTDEDSAAPDDTAAAADADVTDTVEVDVVDVLSEPGPFHVGHRLVAASWDAGGLGGARTVTVNLWYPTEDTSGVATAYLDGSIADPEVYRGAALAPPAAGETYPLLVFSHDADGYAGASRALLTHLASHGWVVAAPDHTGDLATDPEGLRTADYVLRPGDLSATLDALATLPDTDPLHGHLDTAAVIASGHGFGGYAALALGGATYDLEQIGFACADHGGPGAGAADGCPDAALARFTAGFRDPRVTAVIALAPTERELFSNAGVSDLDVPSLLMTGAADAVAPNDTVGDLIWVALPGPAVRVDLVGGCHTSFSTGGCEALLDRDGDDVVNTYALAFARRELLGDETVEPLLTAAVAVSIKGVVSFKVAPSHPYAQRLGDCLGESRPMLVERGLPFGEVAIGEATGWFLLDYASTLSSVDPEGFTGGTPEPLEGYDELFADFDWFGGWAPVWLSVFPHRTVGAIHEAGVLGTDFLALNVYALDYAGGRIYRAEGSGCDELALRGAGLLPLTTEGWFSNDWTTLPPGRVNVPTVPIALGEARTIAQLDTGFEDGVIPNAVNINDAMFDAIADAGITLERDYERDLLLTTCIGGVSEQAYGYRLPPGEAVELVGENGAAVARWEDAAIFLKRAPTAAEVCGGIGTWDTPGAQIGASLIGGRGFILIDPFRARVWWPAADADE